MGFESFRVELRGERNSFAETDALIQKLPHIRLDPEAALSPDSVCYIRDDGLHLFEIELQGSPLRLSCRFTLCHPASVVHSFLELVHELMDRAGMQAQICDDVAHGRTDFFPRSDFGKFASVAERAITVRRAEWAKAFGNASLAATTNEAFQRFILPQCQPVIKKQTC